MSTPRLRVDRLDKAFATPVLNGVSLTVQPGEIHGLVGENGAGKSTLMNILAGMLRHDAGTIHLDGVDYAPANTRAALIAGVSITAQELSLIATLPVAHNILLKRLPRAGLWLDRRAIRRAAEDALARVGLADLDPELPAGRLALAQRQLVEIAKALAGRSRLLILDEPTAALTGPQADRLHDIVRARAANGCSVIYISHRLDDVRAVCDTVSILRDGQVRVTARAADLSVRDMIREMSGQDLIAAAGERPRGVGDQALRVDGLTTAALPHSIDLTCHAGEIVGLAGLAGSGRSELLEGIYGLARRTGGRVAVVEDGRTMSIHTPRQAVRGGVGLLAEDRRTQGILAGHPIAANMTLAGLARISTRWGRIARACERRATTGLIDRLDIRCTGPDQPVDRLSGGNQQKVLLGRWLHSQARVLLLDEPTRGVDVGAKHAIHDHLRALRQAGCAIVVASSEIEELIALCDRILVLSGRKLVAGFDRGRWHQEAILSAAFSEHTAAGRMPPPPAPARQGARP